MRKNLNRHNKTYIIAEIGVNHNGSVKLAKKLVDKAKNAGADAVKFQSFSAQNLASINTPKAKYQKKGTNKKETHFAMLKKLELNEKDTLEIFNYCKAKKIEFISTPYDVQSAQFLKKIGMKIFKTASADISDHFLHEYLSKIKNTIIISTGMSSLNEVQSCINRYKKKMKKNIIILHCVSCYPAPLNILNLNVLDTLRQNFDLEIGFSDHTQGSLASIIAVSKGAKVIEKHFTLNKNMKGPDHKASMNYLEFKSFVNKIRITEKILGNYNKICQKEELEMKFVSTKSIAAKKDINKNEKLSLKNIKLLRPNIGIKSNYIKKILGSKLKRNKKKDEHLFLNDVRK